MKQVLKYILLISVLIVPVIFAAGCGGGGGGPAPTSPPSGGTQAPPSTGIDLANGATISGKANFSGTAPQPKKINMDKEPTCAQKYTEGPFTENVLVNKNNTLQNVFVYVKDGLSGKTFPVAQQAVVLDQNGCRYHAHVFGIQVGQTLDIRNSDGILHNIHPTPKVNKEFNVGQPRVMDTNKTFDKPEIMIPVHCEVHNWMSAYIGVLDHPFYAVTGEDGTFTIKGLPPGDYTIEAWHEQYGTQTQKVTVGAKETKEVDFTFTGS
jgi:hypothetical protein